MKEGQNNKSIKSIKNPEKGSSGSRPILLWTNVRFFVAGKIIV